MGNRQTQRYKTLGKATLTSSSRILRGSLYDLSQTGIGIVLDENPNEEANPNSVWRCYIESRNLAAPLEVIVRVKRQKAWRGGAEWGCEVVEMSHEARRLIKAFQALAKTHQTVSAPSRQRATKATPPVVPPRPFTASDIRKIKGQLSSDAIPASRLCRMVSLAIVSISDMSDPETQKVFAVSKQACEDRLWEILAAERWNMASLTAPST